MTLLQREQKFAEPKGRKKWTNNSWLMSLLHEYTIRKIKTFLQAFIPTKRQSARILILLFFRITQV